MKGLKYMEGAAGGLWRQIILQLGWSDAFRIHRGVAQWCPLSTFLFNMVVDPWLRAMEQDMAWEGIPLSNLSYAKVMAFADDTVYRLTSVSDPRRAEFWIELFQAVSGARVNWDKSCLWGLGPWATEPPAWPTHPELKWVVGSVKYLGI